MTTLRLQRFVVLITGVVVGIVILLVATSIYRERKFALAKAELSTQNLALALEEQARRVFEANRLLLLHASRLLKRRSWDELAADRELHEQIAVLARSPHVHSIWGFDERGIGRVSSRFFPALPSDVSDRDYFLAQQAADAGFFVGRRIQGKSTNDTVFSTSLRLSAPDGSFRGVVTLFARPQYFADFYRSIDLGSGAVFELLYADGTVLARWPELPEASARSEAEPSVAPVRSETAATYRAVWPRDGVERVASMRNLSDLGVVVNVAVSVREVLATWRRTEIPIIVGSSVAILTICALGAMLVMRLREAQRFAGVLDRRVKHRTRRLEASNQSLNLLLREVHHRVKNNLQIISSMLRIQLRRLPREIQPAFTDTFGRIQAMSMIHEQIYGSKDFAAIDFRAFLRQLATALQVTEPAGQRVELRVTADKIRLHLDHATPLALIVNEVVTNAFKHGFPGDRTGTIDVNLSQDGDEITLAIRDDGVGLPAEFAQQKAASFGVTIVDRLCDQLGGACRFESGPGTTFTLTFTAQPKDDERTAGDPRGGGHV